MDKSSFAMGVFIGAAIGLAGLFASLGLNDKIWKGKCVKHGAAEYSQTTGAWQWKEGK